MQHSILSSLHGQASSMISVLLFTSVDPGSNPGLDQSLVYGLGYLSPSDCMGFPPSLVFRLIFETDISLTSSAV